MDSRTILRFNPKMGLQQTYLRHLHARIHRASTDTFSTPFPKKPQHNPAQFTQPEYGAKVQYEPDADTSEKLDANGKKRIQEVLGTLLYYARAVDPTLLVIVSSLA